MASQIPTVGGARGACGGARKGAIGGAGKGAIGGTGAETTSTSTADDRWIEVSKHRDTHRALKVAEHKAKQAAIMLSAKKRRDTVEQYLKETHKKLFDALREARRDISHPKLGDDSSEAVRVLRYRELDEKWKKLMDAHLSSTPTEAADKFPFTFTIDDPSEDEAPPTAARPGRRGRRARRTAARLAAFQKEFDKERETAAAKMRETLKPKPKSKPKWQTHQKPKISECFKCGACFADKGDLNTHLKTKHPKPARLTKCTRCELHVANIGDHVRKAHPVPDGCVACKKCHQHIMENVIGKHLATKCPKAIGTCRHCGKEDRRDLIIEHVKVCTDNPKNQRVTGGAGGAGGPSPSSNPFADFDDE